ncbi:MAG TPA: hypothetical protein VFI06_14500 [Chitinophagaceae bacterium]|nr:hypothetical protein [Chitinophagaceae bacterium]
MRFITSILICICSLIFFNAKSQDCTPPVPQIAAACGTGLPLMDGVSINAGETYSFSGTGGFFSNISVNGGILQICGSATITNLNFNSGTLQVYATGTLTLNGNLNVGSSLNFFNLGNTTFNTNVSVQGSPNFIYNGPVAVMTVNGSLTVFNSGEFINNGTANAQAVTINSGAAFCLGPGSVSNVVSLQNDAVNPVTVSSGTACIRYTTTFNGNQPITSNSSLDICQASGATAPAPAVIGAATVLPNCSSCTGLGATPLRLLSFKGLIINGRAELEWVTAFEEQVRSFIIEQRLPGQSFEAVGEVAANNQPSTYTFNTPVTKDSYFRLKMVDLDGKTTYSYNIILRLKPPEFEMNVLFNPVHKSYAELSITVSRNQRGDLIVLDYMGRRVQKMPVLLTKGNNIVSINLAAASNGQYMVYFRGNEVESGACPFVKQ